MFSLLFILVSPSPVNEMRKEAALFISSGGLKRSPELLLLYCTPFSIPGNLLMELLLQIEEHTHPRPRFPWLRLLDCSLRLVCVRCLKRPPRNLYMLLLNQKTESIPVTPFIQLTSYLVRSFASSLLLVLLYFTVFR